jgi:hypothetical protein
MEIGIPLSDAQVLAAISVIWGEWSCVNRIRVFWGGVCAIALCLERNVLGFADI